MSATGVLEETVVGSLTLRNEPVQARSAARLTALLNAAAEAIDSLGYERLTTAMVAERAGASIGTVYRYFPDRIAILEALGARNRDRAIASVVAAMTTESTTDWLQAFMGAFEAVIDAFRTVPGFRALRIGDVIDLRPAPNERTYNGMLSDVVFQKLVDRFGVPDTAEGRLALEATIEASDALAARAFARDRKGEAAFLDIARDTARLMLVPHFGTPA